MTERERERDWKQLALVNQIKKHQFHFFMFYLSLSLSLSLARRHRHRLERRRRTPTVAATTESSNPRHATPNPAASCHFVSPVFSEAAPSALSAAGASSRMAAPLGTLDACEMAYETANALAARAQLEALATAAGLLAASTAFHEIKKAAEYQSALAKAMDAKLAATRPAAASFALLLLLLLFPPLLEGVEEKRAAPVPEEKEAWPGEEEEETASEVGVEVKEVDRRRRRWNVDGGSTCPCSVVGGRSQRETGIAYSRGSAERAVHTREGRKRGNGKVMDGEAIYQFCFPRQKARLSPKSETRKTRTVEESWPDVHFAGPSLPLSFSLWRRPPRRPRPARAPRRLRPPLQRLRGSSRCRRLSRVPEP